MQINRSAGKENYPDINELVNSSVLIKLVARSVKRSLRKSVSVLIRVIYFTMYFGLLIIVCRSKVMRESLTSETF